MMAYKGDSLESSNNFFIQKRYLRDYRTRNELLLAPFLHFVPYFYKKLLIGLQFRKDTLFQKKKIKIFLYSPVPVTEILRKSLGKSIYDSLITFEGFLAYTL